MKLSERYMFKNLSAAALGISGGQSELIELALTFGFQGFDIEIGEFAARAKVHGVPYSKRLIESARMRLGTFALPFALDADDPTFGQGVGKLSELAEVAAQAGCVRCLTTVAPASDLRPYHENFEFHRKRLAVVAKVLEPAGIRLGVGFRASESLRTGKAFQFLHDIDALLMLLSMVAASNVGLNLDVWEVFVGGGTVEKIRALPAEKLVAVQIANLPADVNAAIATDEHRLLPGDESGVIDMAAVLTAVGELGYAGPVTPAPSRSRIQSTRRDLLVREVGESLTRVWKAAGLDAANKPLATARG